MMASWVFLSHNSSDKPGVESLAFTLLERGIRPWFDKWDLRPGEPWIPAIENALREAGAVLVCLGPHGLGRVHDAELQVALDQAWRDPDRLVVPVLLPGFEGEVPEFLRLRTWVDLRGGVSGGELGKLVRTLEGRAPGPERAVAEGRPYQALDPFREEDAPRFFGRRRAVDELLVRLRAGERFLTLLGASGSGKSSLMLAGLLPAVRSGEVDGSYAWTIVKVRPGGRPCHELARRLLQARKPQATSQDLEDLEQRLRDRPSTLSNEADLLLEGDDARLLLAVDQFEEIFTQAKAEDRAAFVHNLLHAADLAGGRVSMVSTLRADFLGRALESSPELAKTVKASSVVVLPMAEDELREAVVQPALQAGLGIEQGLTETLVREVVGQPGDLPLLEFTLDALWRERQGRRLTWVAYRRLGGLRGAIAHRADVFLADLGSDAEREAVRQVFGRLVHLGEEGPDTRRRASREELAAGAEGLADPLVDGLIEKRLLSAGEDGVEVAHEALIREWPQLRRWVEENREAWRLQEELARAAGRWKETDRAADRLWRGGRLARLRELVERDQVRIAPVERDFMLASEVAERGARRRWARLVVAAFVALSSLTVWALLSSHQAKEQKRRAEDQSRVAIASSLLIEGKTTQGNLVLLEVRQAAETSTAQASLHRALAGPVERITFQGHSAAVFAASFSRDGSRVVTASWDGTGRLWNAKTGAQIATLQGHTDRVFAASFSSDGSRLVTASADGTARLWNAKTGAQIATLQGHRAWVVAASFSWDGSRVVTASSDRTARLWNVETGAEMATLQGHRAWVVAASFSRDGSRVVTASSDRTARLWNVETGAEIATLQGHTDRVVAASFSRDGSRVVTASWDGTARLWNVEKRGEMATLQGHTATLLAASFSRDGSRVVTASDDHTARLWNVETGAEIVTLQGHTDSVLFASFSRDGSHIVTASSDYTARLWIVGRGAEIAMLQGHTDSVRTASFSPDGSRIVTASGDATVRLWNVKTGAQIATLQGHTDSVRTASFSPDGSRVVTASADGTARLWNVETGAEMARFQGHTDSILAASFSPDGSRVVTASEKGTARVWNLETGAEMATLQGHRPTLTAASFSPDGSRVVTASEDHTARLWNVETGAEMATLQGHADMVVAASFSPDGSHVVTASGDGTARLWNAKTGAQMATLQGHTARVRAAWFSPDGSRVVTASADGTARLWAIGTEWLQSRIRSRTLLCLDSDFRQNTLGEPEAEAKRNAAACERCVPTFFERLGDAPPTDWRTYVEAWRVYQECFLAGADE